MMQRREKCGKEVGRVVGEGEKMRRVERSVSGRSGSSYSGIGGGRRGKRLVVVEMKVGNEGSMYIYIWIMEERYWNWMESVKCGTI